MRVDGAPASGRDDSFRPRCLSIDLEVSRNGVIDALGVACADTDESLTNNGCAGAKFFDYYIYE